MKVLYHLLILLLTILLPTTSTLFAYASNIAEDVPPPPIQLPAVLTPIIISTDGVSAADSDTDVVKSDASITVANNPTHLDWDEELGAAFVHSGGRKVFSQDTLVVIRQFIIEAGVGNCDVIINLPEFDFMSDEQRDDLIQDCLDVIELKLNGGLSAEQATTYLQQQHEQYKAALRTFQNNLLASSKVSDKNDTLEEVDYYNLVSSTYDIKDPNYNNTTIRQVPIELYMVRRSKRRRKDDDDNEKGGDDDNNNNEKGGDDEYSAATMSMPMVERPTETTDVVEHPASTKAVDDNDRKPAGKAVDDNDDSKPAASKTVDNDDESYDDEDYDQKDTEFQDENNQALLNQESSSTI